MKRIIKALLGFNLIALVHLFRLRPARFLRACRVAFTSSRRLPGSLDRNDRIPDIQLGEILGQRKPIIALSVAQYEDGMLPSEQAMALLSILVTEAPSCVLEIGTYMGHTTRQMAETLPAATIHTVDLPEDFTIESDLDGNIPKDDFHLIRRRVVGREFKGQPCAARIQQHFADTAHWDFREAGAPTFFFIDGSHTYEYCKSDSEKCFDLCQGQGVFLWHDCDGTHLGVERLILEWRQQGRDIRLIAGTPIAYWKSPPAPNSRNA